MKKISIAIDGPAAAGKSTVAKEVAKRLNLIYIDTGAMYRAFTWAVLENGLDPKDENASCSLIGKVEISLNPDGTVICNGTDVTKEIRTLRVSDNVSYIASYKAIRLELVELQRKIAKTGSCVMDGRDIGTYVLPHADIKIFQVASLEERTERRYKENLEKGIECTKEQVFSDLKKRDYIDSNRAFAPLKPAQDSIIIDTTAMFFEDVVDAIVNIIESKMDIKEKWVNMAL